MKPNPSLDELLCSFMDGELSPRQRTEVQRLAAHDPQVARRLRQLQNCRTLYTALPAARAPSDLLDQIKASLERQTLLQKQPVVKRRAFGAMQLAFRRFVSAAAVITLLGVLGVVVYEIVAPEPWGGLWQMAGRRGPVAAEPAGPVAPVVVVADAGFTGRLELRTARFVQTDTFLGRAIENSGLASHVETGFVGNQRVYQIAGTREEVNRLVASLSGVWQKYFENAALRVDRPEDPAGAVVIEGVTPEQTAVIVAQNSTRASVDTALSYAAMNHMARAMPGMDIRSVTRDEPGSLFAAASMPQPVETGPANVGSAVPTGRENDAPGPAAGEIRTAKSREGAQDKALVNLTIVLLDTP